MGYGQHSPNGPYEGRSRVARTFREYTDCALAWVKQSQDEGRSHGHRMHFTGPVIYSYGSHFPMARIVANDCVLVNCDTASVTTSRHQGEVHHAIRQRMFKHRFDVPTDALKAYDDGDAKRGFDKAISHYTREAYDLFTKSLTARSLRQNYINRAMNFLEEANNFARFYAMPAPFPRDLGAAKLAVALDGNAEALIAINAAIAARAKARDTRRNRFADILIGEKT